MENWFCRLAGVPVTAIAKYHDDACGCTIEATHNTIAHEIGHLLGPPHIRGLQVGGDDYRLGGSKQDAPDGYTSGIANVMAGGDQVWPANAVSWQERMAQHTGTSPRAWWATENPLPPKLLNA